MKCFQLDSERICSIVGLRTVPHWPGPCIYCADCNTHFAEMSFLIILYFTLSVASFASVRTLFFLFSALLNILSGHGPRHKDYFQEELYFWEELHKYPLILTKFLSIYWSDEDSWLYKQSTIVLKTNDIYSVNYFLWDWLV